VLFILRYPRKNAANSLLISLAGFYILQRLFAGISVDSILAVDNVNAMTIFFFFIVAVALASLRTEALSRK